MGKIHIITIWIICFSAIVFSQQAAEPPKVGLALSGGGAKGLAHIGVLKVLEEAGISVDYITGTSMGSIVGSLYAIGYNASDLEHFAIHLDWTDLFTDVVERRNMAMEEKIWDGRYIASLPLDKGGIQLPSGLIAGQKLLALLEQLMWPVHHVREFKELPIPFACVATNIETGQPVVLDSGFLPDAIRASMAIPTVFTPIKIDNKLLVDGGLVRNFPVEDVRDMGAEFVIGVDVGSSIRSADSLNTFFDIIMQSIFFQDFFSKEAQYKLCDAIVKPDVNTFSLLGFGEAREIIDRGEAAARLVLPQLLAKMDSSQIPLNKSRKSLVANVDSIHITELKFDGLRDVSPRLLMSELNLTTPIWLTAKDIENAVERVYSSYFFDKVSYILQPNQKGMRLIIRVNEKQKDIFRFGLRYDNDTKTALLLNTTFRNLLAHGSALIFDLRLGNLQNFDSQYFIHTGFRQRLGLRLRANYSRNDIDIYRGEKRIANMRVRSTFFEGFLGTIFSTKFISGIGMRSESSHISPRIAPESFESSDQNILHIYGSFWMDTFDRAMFPSSGVSLLVETRYTNKKYFGDVDFSRHLLDWKSMIKMNEKLSLSSRIQLGRMFGDNIPLQYKFYLGGLDSFDGLKRYELAGSHFQALQVGAQYEILKNRFLSFRWNMGSATDEWSALLKKRQVMTGFGLAFGIATPIGPIEAIFTGGSRHKNLSYINMGYKF